MGAKTDIEWTDHTFNPWWGCLEVSPGCDHCYARELARRFGRPVWGPPHRTARPVRRPALNRSHAGPSIGSTLLSAAGADRHEQLHRIRPRATRPPLLAPFVSAARAQPRAFCSSGGNVHVHASQPELPLGSRQHSRSGCGRTGRPSLRSVPAPGAGQRPVPLPAELPSAAAPGGPGPRRRAGPPG